MAGTGRFAGWLFDLDGTLVDTAPDMTDTLFELCRHYDAEPPDYGLARASITNGAAGLIRLAFPGKSEQERQTLYEEYLRRYAEGVHRRSRLFDGMEDVLSALEEQATPWGIVTNKPQALTDALLRGLGMDTRAAVTVGGDALPERKPHPAPLLHAARRMTVDPGHCVYVGDNRRDIEAGRAAGMRTIAASYGYLLPDDDIRRWQADVVIGHPDALMPMVRPGAV
jgi:2-phosphoglycolate phosphatase